MANVGAWVWSGNAAKLLADNILVGATTVSATELSYLSGVTSNIQTQLNAKQPTISLTGNRAVATSAGGGLQVSVTTRAELDLLSGVTSNVQAQIDSKLALAGGTLTGALTINTASNQLVLGSGVNALTVNGGTSAAARTYTVPDVGTTADFVMTAGAQTIAGAKTFSNLLTLSAGATITGSISLTDTSSKIFTNTLDAADNKRLQIGGGGDASNSRGSYLNIYGNEYSGSGGYLDCIVGNVAGSLFRVIQLGVSTIVSETDSAVANTLYLKAGNVGIGTASPVSNLHIKAPSGTTTMWVQTAVSNGTGRIVFGENDTSPSFEIYHDGTGVSPNNNLQIRNSAGAVAIAVNDNAAVTLGPAVTNNFTGQIHTVNGSIKSGNVTSTNESGFFVIGNNIRAGTSAAAQLRTETTTGGTGIAFSNKTDNTSIACAFWANQTSDLTNANADVVGSFTQDGAWTLGPSGGGVNHTVSGGLLLDKSAAIATNVSTTGLNRLTFTTASGTINGLSNGVAGQIIFLNGVNAAGSVTLAHNNAGGTQKFLLPGSVNLALTDYEGVILRCDGTFWVAMHII